MRKILLLKIISLHLFLMVAHNNFAQESQQTPTEEVRIFVYYTRKLKNEKGIEAIKKFVNTNIANINIAFANSGIHHSVLLSGLMRIGTDEKEKEGLFSYKNTYPSPYTSDLYHKNFLCFFKLGRDGSGYGAVLSNAEDVESDICVLLVNDLDVDGAADRVGYDNIQIAKGEGNDFKMGYAVFKLAPSTTRNWTMAREIGHIYGCRNEVALDPEGSNEHGYVLEAKDSENRYRHTIMAKGIKANDGVTTPPTPYFSNPDRAMFYEGYPMGDAKANAVEQINEKGYMRIKEKKGEDDDDYTLTDINTGYTIYSSIALREGEYLQITSKDYITMTRKSLDIEEGAALNFYVPPSSTGEG